MPDNGAHTISRNNLAMLSSADASIAASQDESYSATGGVGTVTGSDADTDEFSNGTSSASSARDRLREVLSRQRSTGVRDPDLRSRKEILRQLRTGEEDGLPAAEKLRRLRISQANKGKVPWNAGRKHSPGAEICPHWMQAL